MRTGTIKVEVCDMARLSKSHWHTAVCPRAERLLQFTSLCSYDNRDIVSSASHLQVKNA